MQLTLANIQKVFYT